MSLRIPILLTLTSALLAETVIAQTYPQWWLDKGVVSSQPPAAPGESGHDPATYDAWMVDNHAVANLGQAKNLAKQAYNEMESAGVGSSGGSIHNMVSIFSELPQDNYVPLTIGQLKAISAPFFNAMHDADFTVTLADGSIVSGETYPWTQDVTPNNLAIANTGQLKHVFSFDLTGWRGLIDPDDIDGDGLLDSWEEQIILAGLTDQNGDGVVDIYDVLPEDDYDGDGDSNEDEFILGSSPIDPTNPELDDPDGDGLGSDYELLLGTDPLMRDNPRVNLKGLFPIGR